MDKGIKATLCTTLAFALMFGIATGCSAVRSNIRTGSDEEDPASVTTAKDQAATDSSSSEPAPVTNKLPIQHYPNAAYISVKDADEELPVSGTVGNYEYTLSKSQEFEIPNQKTRGFYIESPERQDATCYFVICSGQKNTGGHNIKIVDLGMNGNRLFIVAEETSPAPDQMVTEALEYPYCVLELDKMPESYEVINTEGRYFSYILEPDMEDDETREILESLRGDGYQVPEGYCAVLNGGAGEIAYKTYVYYHDDGSADQPYYEYINVTSTTVSWGSTIWKDRFDSSGIKNSKEEIVDAARQHGSCDYMTLPGDYRNLYSIDDFLKMDLT